MIRIAVLAGISGFYLFCTNGGVIWGSEIADFAAGFGPPTFSALWMRSDSRETGYWPAYHYGFWAWVAWPVVVPHYFLKSRGRDGILPATILLAILCFPLLCAAVGWYFYLDLPDLRS